MEKCPICNSNGLMLFSSFECENIEYKNFDGFVDKIEDKTNEN